MVGMEAGISELNNRETEPRISHRRIASDQFLADERACLNTTFVESLSSVIIRYLRAETDADGSSATNVLSGPIVCTVPAPSGFVFKTASGTSAPKGAWSDSAR